MKSAVQDVLTSEIFQFMCAYLGMPHLAMCLFICKNTHFHAKRLIPTLFPRKHAIKSKTRGFEAHVVDSLRPEHRMRVAFQHGDMLQGYGRQAYILASEPIPYTLSMREVVCGHDAQHLYVVYLNSVAKMLIEDPEHPTMFVLDTPLQWGKYNYLHVYKDKIYIIRSSCIHVIDGTSVDDVLAYDCCGQEVGGFAGLDNLMVWTCFKEARDCGIHAGKLHIFNIDTGTLDYIYCLDPFGDRVEQEDADASIVHRKFRFGYKMERAFLFRRADGVYKYIIVPSHRHINTGFAVCTFHKNDNGWFGTWEMEVPLSFLYTAHFNGVVTVDAEKITIMERQDTVDLFV